MEAEDAVATSRRSQPRRIRQDGLLVEVEEGRGRHRPAAARDGDLEIGKGQLSEWGILRRRDLDIDREEHDTRSEGCLVCLPGCGRRHGREPTEQRQRYAQSPGGSHWPANPEHSCCVTTVWDAESARMAHPSEDRSHRDADERHDGLFQPTEHARTGTISRGSAPLRSRGSRADRKLASVTARRAPSARPPAGACATSCAAARVVSTGRTTGSRTREPG